MSDRARLHAVAEVILQMRDRDMLAAHRISRVVDLIAEVVDEERQLAYDKGYRDGALNYAVRQAKVVS